MSLQGSLPTVCRDLWESAQTAGQRIEYRNVGDVLTLLHEQAGDLGECLITGRDIRGPAVMRLSAYMLAALDKYARMPIPDPRDLHRQALAAIPSCSRTGVPIEHPDNILNLTREVVVGWAAYTCASPATWGRLKPGIQRLFYGKVPVLLALLRSSDESMAF